jgi:hypothetical protein
MREISNFRRGFANDLNVSTIFDALKLKGCPLRNCGNPVTTKIEVYASGQAAVVL